MGNKKKIRTLVYVILCSLVILQKLFKNCSEEGSGKGLIGEEEMNINEKHKEELNKVTTSTVHMVSETRNSPLVLRTTHICKLKMIRPGVRIKKKLSNVDATSVAMTGGFEKTKAFVQATQEIKEDNLVKEDEEIMCLGNVDYGVGGMKVNAGTKGTTTEMVDVYGGVLNFSQGVGNINVQKLVKSCRLELIIDPFASTAMNIDLKVEKDNVRHRNNWMFATLRNVYLDTSQLNGNVTFDICKWPKREKTCHTNCEFEHGKWKFDVWRWPNRKKKLTHQFLRARIFSRRMELCVEIMFSWNEVVNREVSKWITCSKQAIYQHIEGRRLELLSLVGSEDEWVCRRLNMGWFEDIKECFQLVHLRCYRVYLLRSACSLETEILNCRGCFAAEAFRN
ncbi:hypothetical protein Tco_1263301 [Tanacetum coccineum]